MRVSRSAIVVAVTACSIAVRAADSVPAPPPPPNELAQFDYFLGNWQCEGWDAASVLGPAHQTRTMLTFERELARQWVAMHWSEQRTDANPNPWVLENAFGYDRRSKRFVYVSRDNAGSFATGNSAGWDGATLTIDGDYADDAGQRTPFRDTYVKRGDVAFDFVTETKTDGKWSTDADLKCRKAE